MLQKQELRNQAIAARRALTNCGVRNQVIAERLESHKAFQSARTLLTYVSLAEEVDTHPIIEHALHSGRAVAVPRVAENHRLDWVRIDSINALTPGAFAVLEPTGTAELLSTFQEPVVLVPGVAFDRAGHRLGWGQGYFDRFLTEFSGTSIGLAFDCQLYDGLPFEAHDRPVDYVITETDTIDSATATGHRFP